MSGVLASLGVIGLLILLNAIFVAAEFSLVAAPHTRLAQRAEAGSRAAADVLSIKSSPQQQNRYLATAQVGITIASLGLGMYGEHVVARWLLVLLYGLGRLAEPVAHGIAGVAAIGLLTYLHITLGELVPLSVSLQYAENIALWVHGVMRFLDRFLSPLVAIMNAIGNLVVRLLGVPSADVQSRLFSPEELEFIVEESAERGLMEPTKQRFIENILDLRERTAGQVMTPRNHVVGIPVTASEEDVLARACNARYSRFPVYEQDLDHIIGVLHVKDLARRQVHPTGAFDLRSLLRAAVFVPDSLPLDDVLLCFRQHHTPLAIVIDEFGGTAGLVTLEDVVEKVVGEILDEFDQELPPVEELEPGMLRVRGDLLVDELNQLYDLELEHPETDTVGGFLMAVLGRVAKAGDRVEYEGVEFEVETTERLAVRTVLVRLPRAPEDDDH